MLRLGANILLKYFSTLGPVGYMPVAPGTWGTAVALLFVAALRPSVTAHIIIAAVITVAGIISSGEAEKILNRKDPGHIVIDEFAGYMVSTAFLPASWGYLFSAFILFRIFDILKPPPIKRLQYLPGGWGVMVDDIAAGIYTNLIIQLWRLLIQR